MKKIIASVLTTSILATAIGPVSFNPMKIQADTNSPKSVTDLSKYENNDVIVVYKDDYNATPKKTLKIASLNQEEQANATVDSLTDDTVVLKLNSDEALADAVTALSKDDRVAYVQPNYIYHALEDTSSVLATLQNNTGFANQWALMNDGSYSYEDYDYANMDNSRYGSSYPTIQIQAKEDVDIDLPEAWSTISNSSLATGNRETVVAFVDTGVMYDHTDLAENMWINDAELNGETGVDDDGNGYVDDVYGWNFYDSSSFIGFEDSSVSAAARPGFPSSSGNENGNNTYYNANSDTEDSHGTHGAGTVAAVNNSEGIVGIGANANVKIMTVKTLGGSMGYGTTESIVKGINYAVNNGAHVVNLSLGGEEDDDILRDAIKDNPNVLFTIAAGNEGSNNDEVPTYPANYTYDNVLTVANLQCNGELHYSSNYGEETVHLAAPGSQIYSTSTGDGSGSDSSNFWGIWNSKEATSNYEIMTGTSMAAPMVAGVAAMLYSKYDTFSIQAIRQAILASVDTDSGKYGTLQGKVSTNGVLNAQNAVAYIEEHQNELASYTPAPTKEVTTTPTPTSEVTNIPTTTPAVEVTNTPTTTPAVEITNTPTTTPMVEVTNTPISVPTKEVTHIPTSTATPKATPTLNPSGTPMVTPTPTMPGSHRPTASPLPDIANNGSNTNQTPDATATHPASATNTSKVTATNAPTAKPDTNTATNTNTSSLKNCELSFSSNSFFVGQSYTVEANVQGGSNLNYAYHIIHNGTTVTTQDKTLTWTPSQSGSYTIIAEVSDHNGNKATAFAVESVTGLSLTSLTANKALKKGATVKFTAKTNNYGFSPFKYSFVIYRNNKKVTAKTLTKNTFSYKIRKAGTYKIKVTVKDSKGNTSTKTLTKHVK